MRYLKLFLLFTVFASHVLLSGCGGSYSHEITETWPDGTTKTIQYYKEKEGEQIFYKIEEFHDNGVKRVEGYYKDDERHGRWNSWHSNGKLWSIAEYKNGQLDGKQTVYHISGQKYYEGTFEKGIRTGIWRFWDENGILVTETEY